MKTLVLLVITTLFLSCQKNNNKEAHEELSSIFGNITVCTSDNNKLRFYSWEDDRSGTASSYTNIAEFINESGNLVRLEKPIAEFITGKREKLSPDYEVIKVFTVECLKSNYYIVVTHGKASSSIGCGLIVTLRINDDKLVPIHALDSKSYISYSYNFFDDKFESISDEELADWSWLCSYDGKTSILYVRQFDEDGKLTEMYQEYKLK